MQIDPKGWLTQVKHVPSPFYNERLHVEDVSLLVIHNISLPPGEFGGPYIEQLFTGQLNANQHPFFAYVANLQVSAHCLIRRDGEVVQFVPFGKRAWHAGVSSFAGRDQCNDYSIGIELEGTDFLPYTKAQYAALKTVAKLIQIRYPVITTERITGHQYIAPVRKTDPGLCFNWQVFHTL